MTFKLIFSSEIYRYVNKNILNHCFNGQFCLCKCCMIIFVCKCCQLFIHIIVDKRIYIKKKEEERKKRGFYRDITDKNNGKQLFFKIFYFIKFCKSTTNKNISQLFEQK